MRFEKILVVEDEPVVALDLQQTLEKMGHEVCAIRSSFQSAMEAVEEHSPTLILMDIHLQGLGDGIDACRQIYARWGLPVVFLTAFADEKTVNRAAACKPFGYLMKPYLTKELYAVLQVARSRHDAELSLVRSEERLELAMEAAQLGTWEWESQLDQIKGDARFGRIWGSTLSPFSAGLQAMLARIHPQDRDAVALALTTAGFFTCEFRATRELGGYAWLEMYGNLRTKGSGHQVVVGAIRDITARKEMEERLRQASVVFTAIAEGIMILDNDGALTSVNPAFSRLTGYEKPEVDGRKPREFLLVDQGDVPTYLDIAALPVGYWSGEALCKAKDGQVFNALQQICVVRDQADLPVNYVHTISDLTAIRATERQLVQLAFHDQLTNLPNRRLFLDRLRQALSASDRSGQAGALLFIDLDDFKTLNDTLGHDMGDMLLEQVAARLTASVREGDTVARLGGDEFMVMLEQLGGNLTEAAAHVELIGNKVIAALGLPYQLGATDYQCTCSIGVTLFEGNQQRHDELVKQADIAMYQSKKSGRNRLSFFDPAMQHAVNRRATLEAELHKALQHHQFLLHYQVQVDLQHRPVGAEALIRWRHPERGMVSPGEFIEAAEDMGLILPIGHWVLQTACAQLATWSHHPTLAALTIAVNVSAKQLRQPHFVDEVRAVVLAHAINPKLLKLEITEGMLLHDVEETIQTMLALKTIGVQFSLDDFGTGYSSLQYLKRLPLDQLKIDQSFVRDLTEDGSDRTIVRTIITMAQNLGLGVIAEGVETQAQSALLRAMGCEHYQGYLFGRPLPIDLFEASLR